MIGKQHTAGLEIFLLPVLWFSYSWPALANFFQRLTTYCKLLKYRTKTYG